MNLDKFKHQHTDILNHIDRLRYLSKAGVTLHAQDIARLIVEMSAIIKLHLSAEDSVLYPALQQHHDPDLAMMGQAYQQDMEDIAAEYNTFSRRWNTAASLCGNDDAFRQDANHVLRRVYERMQRENHDFYPRIATA
ncbi:MULTISPECIES: hemerythrin domain-containing protein [Dickeya]|uniref:Hemerythrin-like domain-containing protein n=1 Tax=Dickeya aquatica TaxID=1401087 RepID=A0A375AAQ3_9GAMM|nr:MULTISPECIES: hemerythrin domain-containing protein [Dickeya]SLM63178.1 FIG00904844: hypothetical protein [Dickeya aquatica]